MPALTGVASSETACMSCMTDLESSALRCKHCQGFTHARCSGLPTYMLVRYHFTQASYSCIKCVRTEELKVENYERSMKAVEELLAAEESALINHRSDDTILDLVNSTNDGAGTQGEVTNDGEPGQRDT